MNRLAPTMALYFRDPEMSAQDRADLEAYYAMLRSYYDIPDGEPVFPDTDGSTDIEPGPSRLVRRPTGTNTNPAHHPWRRRLHGEKP